jgi:hypothetical protein
LHLLDTSTLSDSHFANIFSWPEACLSIYLILPFVEPKLFILMEANFSVFSLLDHAFDVSKNSLSAPKLPRFSPISSQSLMSCDFTFKSVVYFGLICVQCIRSVSKFSFMSGDSHVFLHHLLKRLSSVRHVACALVTDQLTLFM